jgi:hypothetical protein
MREKLLSHERALERDRGQARAMILGEITPAIRLKLRYSSELLTSRLVADAE